MLRGLPLPCNVYNLLGRHCISPASDSPGAAPARRWVSQLSLVYHGPPASRGHCYDGPAQPSPRPVAAPCRPAASRLADWRWLQ